MCLCLVSFSNLWFSRITNYLAKGSLLFLFFGCVVSTNQLVDYIVVPHSSTVFENHSKCRIRNLAFFTNFVFIKLTCLVTLFERKFQVLKNSPNWPFFFISNELLSTQYLNVACFARNFEWDFFGDFQTPFWRRNTFFVLM